MGSTPGIFPLGFFDAPSVLNASTTPIPANTASPVQVVANIGSRAVSGISYLDSTGDYIGVYIGSVGSEQLVCVIGGGFGTIIPVVIAARSRISLRSMTNVAITNGYLFCTFLGQGWGPM